MFTLFVLVFFFHSAVACYLLARWTGENVKKWTVAGIFFQSIAFGVILFKWLSKRQPANRGLNLLIAGLVPVAVYIGIALLGAPFIKDVELPSATTGANISSTTTNQVEGSGVPKATPTSISSTTTPNELTTSTTALQISPEEQEQANYRNSTQSLVRDVVSSLVSLDSLFQNTDPYDQMWVINVSGELLSFRDAYSTAQELRPPNRYASAHKLLLSALKDLNNVSYDLPKAIDSLNMNAVNKQSQKLWGTLKLLDNFGKSLK